MGCVACGAACFADEGGVGCRQRAGVDRGRQPEPARSVAEQQGDDGNRDNGG